MQHEEILSHFLNDIKDHTLTFIHESDLVRHIRLSKPGTNINQFDLITWPGHLCITGDCGTYVFSRIPDMFAFFRTDNSGINPGYWSEKVLAVDVPDGLKEYSKEAFREAVADELNDREATEEIRQRVAEEVLCYDDNEYEARKALYDFEVDGKQYFADTWEWKLQTFTPRYLWCCYAIVWGIQQYDKAKNKEIKDG